MTRSNLVGGELLNWSDLHPADARPAAGGPAAAALLAATLRPDHTVLVAGPHAADLISAIASQVTSVDVLVRSASDAEELADVLESAKGEIFCGSIDRFATATKPGRAGAGAGGYDVVVALDGMERLVGPDTAGFSWTDSLERLAGLVGSAGTVLFGAVNAFGFERLVQPEIGAALPRDEDWGREVGDRAPAGFKRVMKAVEGAGLRVAQTYAVFPSLVQADVALTEVDGLAAVVAARAVASRNNGPVLMDPYRAVLDAADAGVAFELAPAWYVVVGAQAPPVLPAHVVPDGGGVLLEEHLMTALRCDDQAELRRVIPSYVAWLGAGGAGSPDNVVVDGGSYRLFGEAQELDVVGHLRRFATRVLESGSRQPWPAAADPHQLTARLASMAGITVPEQEFSPDEVVRPRGSAEQLRTVARLADELADASARAILFEGTVSGIRRSRPYRIGHAVLNPARVVRRRLKRVLKKVRR